MKDEREANSIPEDNSEELCDEIEDYNETAAKWQRSPIPNRREKFYFGNKNKKNLNTKGFNSNKINRSFKSH